MHWVGEAVRTNRSQVWDYKVLLEGLADVPSGLQVLSLLGIKLITVWVKIYFEFDTSLDNTNLKWLNSEPSKLGCDEERAFLRNDQEITIRVVKCGFAHILVE